MSRMTSDRDSLFQTKENTSNQKKNRVWGINAKETEETKNLDNSNLLQLQKQKIKEQDETLDKLGESVLKTKQIAIAIGTETDEQMALLDDIDSKVDRTNARIRNTTRRVERIQTKSSTKVMWCCILILFIGLIVVTILAVYL